MRVWFFGVAIGIPLFHLFTAGRNFYAVKRDGFARYDRSIAIVTARPIGMARRTFAILVFIALFGTNIALIALAKSGDLVSHTQERWTNTATAQTVALPAGWSFVEVKPDGKAVTTFATTDGRYVLYFARESVNVLPNAPDGTPPFLTAYAFVITQTTSPYVTMRGDWAPATISGQDVLRREASLKGGPGAASYFIWRSAGSFWRTVVIDLDPSRPPADEAATMVASLARSTP